VAPDLRLLCNRLFRSCNGVMFLGSAAFIGTLYVVTLFFQDGRGLSALVAGAVRGGRGPESSGRPTVGMPSSPEGKVRE
jgi:hypothetical protein